MKRFDHLRKDDWNIRFVEFLKDSMDIADDLVIDWDSEGITCFSWVSQGIEEMTGHNPHDQFIGRYTSLTSLCLSMRKLGYTCLDDGVADMFPEVPVSMCQRGDIALIPFARWNVDHLDEALAPDKLDPTEMMPHSIVLCDPPFYYGVTEQGLVKGDLYANGVRAFAVGRII